MIAELEQVLVGMGLGAGIAVGFGTLLWGWWLAFRDCLEDGDLRLFWPYYWDWLKRGSAVYEEEVK